MCSRLGICTLVERFFSLSCCCFAQANGVFSNIPITLRGKAPEFFPTPRCTGSHCLIVSRTPYILCTLIMYCGSSLCILLIVWDTRSLWRGVCGGTPYGYMWCWCLRICRGADLRPYRELFTQLTDLRPYRELFTQLTDLARSAGVTRAPKRGWA